MLFLKNDSNSKHFSFFVCYFNLSNKISSTPAWLLNFQQFSNPLPVIPIPQLINFWRISPVYSNLPSIRHSRVTNNADLDTYKYSGYSTEFDSQSELLFTDGFMGKDIIILGADMSLSVHIDYKDIRYMNSWWRTNTRIRWYHINTRAKYPINFTQSRKKCVLSQDNNDRNSF